MTIDRISDRTFTRENWNNVTQDWQAETTNQQRMETRSASMISPVSHVTAPRLSAFIQGETRGNPANLHSFWKIFRGDGTVTASFLLPYSRWVLFPETFSPRRFHPGAATGRQESREKRRRRQSPPWSRSRQAKPASRKAAMKNCGDAHTHTGTHTTNNQSRQTKSKQAHTKDAAE